MARVTVHHLTSPARLPMIEEQGLRTRADLSKSLGPIGAEDEAAPGAYAHGKRVSGYLDLEHARSMVDQHGGGLVSFTVDPRKAIAAPGSARDAADPSAYWAAAKPLADVLEGAPTDLEVHQPVGVRSKFVEMKAPLMGEAQLGVYAPLVAAVADEDRLSAKALMHLAIIASEGDFESDVFNAACALAWRDTPDADDLVQELVELDPDKIVSAALAEFGTQAPDATEALRGVLEATREWSDENNVERGRGILARTAMVLDTLQD